MYSLNLFDQNISTSRNRAKAFITGRDWKDGIFQTNIISFTIPGLYFSYVPNGTLTMKKVSS